MTRMLIGLLSAALLTAGWSAPVSAQEEAAAGTAFKGMFMSSLSLRNAQTESRIEIVNGVPDTLKNPFDYEMSFGIDGNYGPWHFIVNEVYERQNNNEFFNQEYQGKYKHKYAEAGLRIVDNEAASLKLHTGYVEAIIMEWVGLGVTRQYTEFWFEQGATLGRISLAKEQHTIMGIDLTLRATYEWNPDQYRVYAYADIRNLIRGRYALVPFVKWERIYLPSVTRDAYQAKVMLTVQI